MNFTLLTALVRGITMCLLPLASPIVQAGNEFPEISWESIDRIIGFQKGKDLNPRDLSRNLKRQFQAYYELRIRGNEQLSEIEEASRRLAGFGVRMSDEEIREKISVQDSLWRLDQLMTDTLDRISDKDYVATWRPKALELRGGAGVRPGTTRAPESERPEDSDLLAAARVAGFSMPAAAHQRPSLLNPQEREFDQTGRYSFEEIAALARAFRADSHELEIPPTPSDFWQLYEQMANKPSGAVDPIASRLLIAIILTAEADREVKSTPKIERKPGELLRFFHKTRRLAWAFEDLDEARQETKVNQRTAVDVLAALTTIRNRYGAL